jgi:hypothetical protein
MCHTDYKLVYMGKEKTLLHMARMKPMNQSHLNAKSYSALNVKVKKFNQVWVNSRSNYDSLEQQQMMTQPAACLEWCKFYVILVEVAGKKPTHPNNCSPISPP